MGSADTDLHGAGPRAGTVSGGARTRPHGSSTLRRVPGLRPRTYSGEGSTCWPPPGQQGSASPPKWGLICKETRMHVRARQGQALSSSQAVALIPEAPTQETLPPNKARPLRQVTISTSEERVLGVGMTHIRCQHWVPGGRCLGMPSFPCARGQNERPCPSGRDPTHPGISVPLWSQHVTPNPTRDRGSRPRWRVLASTRTPLHRVSPRSQHVRPGGALERPGTERKGQWYKGRCV